MTASAEGRAWLEQDPDPATRAELAAVLESADSGDAGALADLEDRFDGTLEFGTAGLRGRLGAGSNRMNRVVVSRAAAGLTRYLDEVADPGQERPLVVGFDARHNSERFALDTAEITAATGRPVVLLPRPLPTPVLAFAVRRLGAAAGVMVTASHNPPADNGYKVYLGDGSQIVPPADRDISERIAFVGDVREVPRSSKRVTTADEALIDEYVSAAVAVAPTGPRDLRIVHTSLHGVGAAVMRRVFVEAGFTDVHEVLGQAEPNPDFPTVAFPNPEEAGALDLAMTRATEVDADLIIANDPDADRCAVAVPDPAGSGWQMLRGDEVGALLAHHLLGTRTGTFATTIVSSSLLSVMTAATGADYAETLTGFKWLSKTDALTFAYEEALGYCVDPERVNDKDGISAALLMAHLAAEAKAGGRTLLDLLDDIAADYGLHATDQLSIRLDDMGRVAGILSELLSSPPESLGGLDVIGVEDLSEPSSFGSPLPPTAGLRIRLAEGTRVIVRPSGTEPKLKCYAEVVVPLDTDLNRTDSAGAARIAAAGRLDAMLADLGSALR